MIPADRQTTVRVLSRAVLRVREAPGWIWRCTVAASRRYSESLVRRALEGESESRAQTWVWGASGVR